MLALMPAVQNTLLLSHRLQRTHASGAVVWTGRSCIIVAARDRPRIAIGTTGRGPAKTVAGASFTTRHIRSPALAPSATRMPISFLRRATL